MSENDDNNTKNHLNKISFKKNLQNSLQSTCLNVGLKKEQNQYKMINDNNYYYFILFIWKKLLKSTGNKLYYKLNVTCHLCTLYQDSFYQH